MDCEWSDWEMGGCSVTCGEGTRTNTRTKKVDEANGGVCIGEPTAEENCNDQDCPGKTVLYFIYSMCYISFFIFINI